MITAIVGNDSEIWCEDIPYRITPNFLKLYEVFNKKKFKEKIIIPSYLVDFANFIYDTFNQDRPTIELCDTTLDKVDLKTTNDVILGYSGGLDSTYQAIMLKEMGYNVHLFHLRNLNSYEGNNSYKSACEFAESNGMELIEAYIKKKNKSQEWEDNPIKNQLIVCLMLDICTYKGWNKVSMGNDLTNKLANDDTILGINTTDCYETYNEFFKLINGLYNNFEFIPIKIKTEDESNIFSRLKKLYESENIDRYYSCVGAGRFNKYNHDLNEEKYNIHLPKYNCGCSCTKCALHNLNLHYNNSVIYPKDFIDKCWERLWNTKHGSLDKLFGKDVPFKTKLENLFNY